MSAAARVDDYVGEGRVRAWSAGCSYGAEASTLDLVRMRIAPKSLDLILCRTTVIPFNGDVRDDLHRRLVGALRPGGVLVVGATERVADAAALGLSPTHPFTPRRTR